MDEDEVISKITRLLEKGCTMLATHHDCGAPLFRCQGEVVCPVCSFAGEPGSPATVQPIVQATVQATAQPSGSLEEEPDEKSNIDRAHLHERTEIDDDELMAAMDNLRASLLHRLQEFTAALEDESDLDRLKKQLDCLEGLLRVFRSLHG